MRLRLLELLCCPVCGGVPLSLTVLREIDHPTPEDHPLRHSDPAGDREIVEGVLRCPGCGRWFCVREGIADLVRDGLREDEAEIAFLESHRDRLPEDLLNSGIPLNLRRRTVERTEEDRHIVGEGRYWGEFMEVHWDVGDRSIFDCRVRSTHPGFFGQGVLEADDRDRTCAVGIWPDHLAHYLFLGWMDDTRGARALDVGCGGGQFGLEAARRGLDVVGLDPSRRAMELGRIHAMQTGAEIQYVRGDPRDPPFPRHTFDVWLAKSSLHHIPEVADVIAGLDERLRPGGLVAVYEHIGHSPRRRRVMEWLQPRLIPRIQRRYGMVEVPEILLRESPNEDAGMSALEPALHRFYVPLHFSHELFLYFDVEQLVYFATGKRRFPAWVTRRLFWIYERLLLADGEQPELLAFVGRKPLRRAGDLMYPSS